MPRFFVACCWIGLALCDASRRARGSTPVITYATTTLSDAVQAFLEGAGRYPLLTKAAEVHLGTLVRAWLDSANPSPQQIRAGKRAKRKLFESNLRLVASRARAFLPRAKACRAELEDLFQEGCLGLNRACEKFDPTRGRAFSTYCCAWIEQGIRRYLDGRTGTIYLPSSQITIRRRWKYREENETLEVFSERYGYKPESVRESLRLVAQADAASLDARLHEGGADGSSLGDLLADPDSEPSTDQLDLERSVRHLEALSPDDFALVELSVVDGYKGSQLGDLLGVSGTTANKQIACAKERLAALGGADVRALVA